MTDPRSPFAEVTDASGHPISSPAASAIVVGLLDVLLDEEGTAFRPGRPGARRLMFARAAPRFGGTVEAAVDHFLALPRGVHYFIARFARRLGPGLHLLCTSILRDAPEHRDGRAADLSFRGSGYDPPALHGRSPGFNTNHLLIGHLITQYAGTVRERSRGLDPGARLKELGVVAAYEYDHLHCHVGPPPREPGPYVYFGDAPYQSVDRWKLIEASIPGVRTGIPILSAWAFTPGLHKE